MTLAKRYYSYKGRRGVKEISWDDFHGLCKGLAKAVRSYDPEIIIGIARGGLYPATLLSHILQKELYPIRITRRENDSVSHSRPRWLVRPPATVKGKKILLVDEICDTGETLALAKEELKKKGAKEVRSAVLYAHSKNELLPDHIGMISDALILNPWDREILKKDSFVLHPEYAAALEQQGNNRSSLFLLRDVRTRRPKK